jgi:hypothetical protein
VRACEGARRTARGLIPPPHSLAAISFRRAVRTVPR